MMDLDNIPDTQTEAEELEEVVMGLIINSLCLQFFMKLN